MQIQVIVILLLLCLVCTKQTRPRNCLDIRDSSDNAQSGEYIIYPGISPMSVWCDMVSGGGGWTVFQRRFDGSVNFYRNWNEYKRGFGNVNGGEFWLGNDNIHTLTTSTLMELRIDVEGHEDRKFARFSLFALESEGRKYTSTIMGYQSDSTLGDSFTFHGGFPFSTFDRDNDVSSANCASSYKGGWWYGACHHSNLNGRYGYTPPNQGNVGTYAATMTWLSFNNRGFYYALKAANMKVRPINSNTCEVKDGESMPFGPCSVTYGEGVRVRVFFCTFPGNGTRRTILEQEKCNIGTPTPGSTNNTIIN